MVYHKMGYDILLILLKGYVIFIIADVTINMMLGLELSRVEEKLVWPATKCVKGLNVILRKARNYFKNKNDRRK